MSRQSETAVTATLRLVIDLTCPECGSHIQWPVSDKHWIFDAPVGSEVCPHCLTGLEVYRPEPEDLPVALGRVAEILE